jgi:hypothetical protein
MTQKMVATGELKLRRWVSHKLTMTKLIPIILKTIDASLNIWIASATIGLSYYLINSTSVLLDFHPSYELDMLFLSVQLPITLLSIFISLIVLIRELNFTGFSTRSAISLLLFNSFSLLLLYKFFPLITLESYFANNLYQVFIASSGYISCIYGILYIWKNLTQPVFKVRLSP